MPDDTPASLIGNPVRRIEGRAKVTGAARYPSDEHPPDTAYAALVTSSIARGRILGFGLDAALAVPGAIEILTHESVGGESGPEPPHGDGGVTTTMQDDRIWYAGQIIAVALAESLEAAAEAARLVEVSYDRQEPSATFDSPGVEEHVRGEGMHRDFAVGDAEAAFRSATVTLDERYETPTQHHNPIELFTTTCLWTDGVLTILEPSQFVHGLRGGVARQLRLDPQQVRVVSRLVGGAFGSKGAATSRTSWIAVAARRLGRPVKLVPTRKQGYTITTYRAETRHRVRLGTDRDGRLVSLRHEGWEVTSRPSDYSVSGTETTARLYRCANIRTTVNIVHADRATPGYMRAPPDFPYMFALESAVDELAGKLRMDPIEWRRLNDTATDPATGLPFSSRSLMRCFDAGAERFGWSGRDPAPGSLRDGDWLVGLGCAAAAYPSNIAPAAARVALSPDGRASVHMAAHEIGNGATTAIAITAASLLGLPVERVDVRLGDSELPEAGIAAGSSHTATICNAVAAACETMRLRVALAACQSNHATFAGDSPDTLRFAGGRLVNGVGRSEPLDTALSRVAANVFEVRGEHVPAGMEPGALRKIAAGQMALSRGTSRPDATAFAFGAQFVEMRIHARTREIKVPRALGAFAGGRIINRTAAHSQYMSGMIWGIGGTLLEATDIDRREARYMNDNLSDYLIATSADVGEIDVLMLPEQDDQVNPLGIKGIGEIGIVGMNAAIANAVHHATGRRVRKLPIRIEDLLD